MRVERDDGLPVQTEIVPGEAPPRRATDHGSDDHVSVITLELKQLIRKETADIARIGNLLHQLKAQLRRGEFGKHVKAKIGIKPSTALNYMRASALISKNAKFADLPPSALYQVAAAPQEAKAIIAGRLEDGGHVTFSEIADLIRIVRKRSREESGGLGPAHKPDAKDDLVDGLWSATRAVQPEEAQALLATFHDADPTALKAALIAVFIKRCAVGVAGTQFERKAAEPVGSDTDTAPKARAPDASTAHVGADAGVVQSALTGPIEISRGVEALEVPIAPTPAAPKEQGVPTRSVLTATMRPTRQGSYSVEFEGETIVANSRNPERATKRELLSRGYKGLLCLVDNRGTHRSTISIK